MTARLRKMLAAVRRYPTIGVSLFIILLLLGMGIYAIVHMPLSEATERWSSGTEVWGDNPKTAQPAWTNWFRREDLPKTMVVRMADVEASREALSETMERRVTPLAFEYEYFAYPSEIVFYYTFEYAAKRPLVTLTWIRPDGSEIQLYRDTPQRGVGRMYLSDMFDLGSLFGAGAENVAFPGTYTLRIEVVTFEEEGFSMDGRLVVYGRVHGIAGTDDQRRDLWLALLWGAPIALMYGVLATIGTTIVGFVLAAIGSWFGGAVDSAVQRVTEVGMMIPFLPTIMMVGKFYSTNIWVVMGFVIGLNLFTGAIKSYRAMFLQVRMSPYIEAAHAYGASNRRIIFRYMMPQIAPVLLPQFILGIPRFVYLEASLALLGISDPRLLTWGKILAEGRNGLFAGHYYWVLEPTFLLILTGVAFSMLGYALDRVFNPRLRDI